MAKKTIPKLEKPGTQTASRSTTATSSVNLTEAPNLRRKAAIELFNKQYKILSPEQIDLLASEGFMKKPEVSKKQIIDEIIKLSLGTGMPGSTFATAQKAAETLFKAEKLLTTIKTAESTAKEAEVLGVLHKAHKGYDITHIGSEAKEIAGTEGKSKASGSKMSLGSMGSSNLSGALSSGTKTQKTMPEPSKYTADTLKAVTQKVDKLVSTGQISPAKAKELKAGLEKEWEAGAGNWKQNRWFGDAGNIKPTYEQLVEEAAKESLAKEALEAKLEKIQKEKDAIDEVKQTEAEKEKQKRFEAANPYYKATMQKAATAVVMAPTKAGEAVGKAVSKVGSAISDKVNSKLRVAQVNQKYVDGGMEALTEEEKKIYKAQKVEDKPAATTSKTTTPKAETKTGIPQDANPDIKQTATNALRLYNEGKMKDFSDLAAGLKRRGWSDEKINQLSDEIEKQSTQAGKSEVTSKTIAAAVNPASRSSSQSGKAAGKAGTVVSNNTTPPATNTTTPDPDPNKPGATAEPEIAQKKGEVTSDPKGDLGDQDGAATASATAVEKKAGFKWGTAEALGAGQVGLGLVGADKYSKLSEKLIKDYPMDTIPIEAQTAYADAQTAKDTMLTRSRQGFDAAQKAELEAKIEGSAAADLVGATNPLSRTLGVRAKYDALLGMASMDEQVRSQNEQKYLAALEGANQEGARMSMIKRQLYEDRTKKWQNEYQRALMGEQAGANLLTAGISNIATSVQMKEIEAMKGPSINNYYQG